MPQFWHYIAPVAKTNLITNPSFERGTASWGTIQAGTIGTTSALQQFGAWSGSVAPTSNGTTGVKSPTFTAVNGVDYTASAYIRGANGIPYRFGVGDSNGANMVGSMTFTGGGTWHRYSFSWTEAAGATRALAIKKNASADTSAFYVDGVQVEAGSLTTYIDGDAEGCQWLGAPHASQSSRDGQSRAGGSVIALADIGFTVNDHPGIGMPPLETTAQSYAIIDGGQFQRQRAAPRTFTLAAQMDGTSQGDYHSVRRAVINALKIDAFTPQQPTRFWYTGAGGTVQIDAIMDAGLEGGAQSGFSEIAGIQFTAFDPYWRTTTQEGTSLAPRINLGSTNFIVKRDAQGLWGTLGVAGTTTDFYIQELAYDGADTLYVGGTFGSAGGTVAKYVAQYSRSLNRWGTLTNGTLDAPVRAMARNANGTLFVGGQFGQAGGTTAAGIAQYINGAWGTLTGGTITAAGFSFVEVIYPAATGTLFVGGAFNGAGGTSTRSIVQHVNGVWGTLTGGTLQTGASRGEVYAITQAPNGTLYVGGLFGTAGGTANANNIAFHMNGTWGTINGGALGDDASIFVNDFCLAPNGLLYVAGQYGTIGGIKAANIASWNGVQMSALGGGIPAGGTSNVDTPVIDPWGHLLVGGQFLQGSAGDIAVPDSGARWNGAMWHPLDIDITGNAYFYRFLYTPDNTLYAAGSFIGTATAASVGTIVNNGMAIAYPTLRMRNAHASGTARIYQLLNNTTNDRLYFNLSLLAGEEAILQLQPGERTFQSSWRGDIFRTIIPGSNLAAWRLLPGTNYISFYADNDSLAVDLFWTPRAWSSDQGRIG